MTKEGILPFSCLYCEKKQVEGYKVIILRRTFNRQKKSNICSVCGRSVFTIDQIKIVGPFLIVKPTTPEIITKKGIILPATLWRVWNIGEVIKTAERKTYTCFKLNKNRKHIGKVRTFTNPGVVPGDIVLFQKYAPRGYDLGRGNIYFLHWDDAEIKLEKGVQIYPM